MSRCPSGVLRALWSMCRTSGKVGPSGLYAAIMRAHRVQTWFQRQRGVPMVKRHCPACGKERMYTIWHDGRYYCIPCLYRQASGVAGWSIPIEPDDEVMHDFASAWTSFRAYIEAFEEPWAKPDTSFVRKLGRISLVGPPPICRVDACRACDGLRPFMLRDDGDAGCAYCLMRGRIVEFSVEISDDEIAA